MATFQKLHPPSPPPPQFCSWEQRYTAQNISLDTLGQPTRCGGRVRNRESLDAGQTLLSSGQNLGLLSTCFGHRSEAQHCTGCCEEN